MTGEDGESGAFAEDDPVALNCVVVASFLLDDFEGSDGRILDFDFLCFFCFEFAGDVPRCELSRSVPSSFLCPPPFILSNAFSLNLSLSFLSSLKKSANKNSNSSISVCMSPVA